MQGIEALPRAALKPDAVSAPATAAVDKRAEAQDTARQFEQIFLRQMLEGMRKTTATSPEGSLFGDGPGAGTYEDWFDTHFANHLSEGRGIGLAQMMLEDWARHGHVPGETEPVHKARTAAMNLHASLAAWRDVPETKIQGAFDVTT